MPALTLPDTDSLPSPLFTNDTVLLSKPILSTVKVPLLVTFSATLKSATFKVDLFSISFTFNFFRTPSLLSLLIVPSLIK